MLITLTDAQGKPVYLNLTKIIAFTEEENGTDIYVGDGVHYHVRENTQIIYDLVTDYFESTFGNMYYDDEEEDYDDDDDDDDEY